MNAIYISSNFLQECTFPPVTACHTNPKKRLTNLDDTLCSFPRVLWNSVTLWPCRCHSQVFGWLDHRERHGPSLKCLCVVSCHFFALKSFPSFCHRYGMDIRKGSKFTSGRDKKKRQTTSHRAFLGFPTVANIRERFIKASWCPACHCWGLVEGVENEIGSDMLVLRTVHIQ